MKKKWIGLLAIGIALNILMSANSYAQEDTRVIEEELVLKDPTVAAKNKWVIGGSYDYWYVGGDYTTYDSNGKKLTEGTIKGDMNGGSVFVGYDFLTFQYTYREGAWDIDSKYINQPINTKTRQEQAESEMTLRFLYKIKYVSPYALVGYNDIKLNVTDKIVTPGWIWTYNGKTTYSDETTFRSGLVGLGVIVPVPFVESLGIRLDGRLMSTSAERIRDDGKKWTGSGFGYGGTVTGYWNIFKGVNLQAGAKYQKLDGGDVGWYDKIGYFGSLGYSYKF